VLEWRIIYNPILWFEDEWRFNGPWSWLLERRFIAGLQTHPTSITSKYNFFEVIVFINKSASSKDEKLFAQIPYMAILAPSE
jgi:hypothetical protein